LQDQRDELVRHYLSGELVVGKEKETRLTKTLLPTITAADLLEVAQQFKISCSCVIKAASAKRLAAANLACTFSHHPVSLSCKLLRLLRNLVAYSWYPL
jgi:hypothetical protein